ncbi:MAG: ankyrin repeat domain-containing protein [Alphaproteobacteria bacterium]|nr:MAG: ankyrin repeat domain-containing protein [Alphaproteobacteria bacterium]
MMNFRISILSLILINNLSCEHGCTPLMIASLRGHIEAVRVLIECGANVNLQITMATH